jgi:hypothetical protein
MPAPHVHQERERNADWISALVGRGHFTFRFAIEDAVFEAYPRTAALLDKAGTLDAVRPRACVNGR